jgi:hypothetical protein
MSRRALVFAEFLRLVPRYVFQRIVKEHNGDYRTKRFKCQATTDFTNAA